MKLCSFHRQWIRWMSAACHFDVFSLKWTAPVSVSTYLHVMQQLFSTYWFNIVISKDLFEKVLDIVDEKSLLEKVWIFVNHSDYLDVPILDPIVMWIAIDQLAWQINLCYTKVLRWPILDPILWSVSEVGADMNVNFVDLEKIKLLERWVYLWWQFKDPRVLGKNLLYGHNPYFFKEIDWHFLCTMSINFLRQIRKILLHY